MTIVYLFQLLSADHPAGTTPVVPSTANQRFLVCHLSEEQFRWLKEMPSKRGR